MTRPLTLVVKDEPSSAVELRAAVDRVAAECGLSADASFELKVAATEALANAFRHSASEAPSVNVALGWREDAVEVEVTNRGTFRPEIQFDAESGRGIPLMVALADEVEFSARGGGTRVRIRKCVSRERPEEALPA